MVKMEDDEDVKEELNVDEESDQDDELINKIKVQKSLEHTEDDNLLNNNNEKNDKNENGHENDDSNNHDNQELQQSHEDNKNQEDLYQKTLLRSQSRTSNSSHQLSSANLRPKVSQSIDFEDKKSLKSSSFTNIRKTGSYTNLSTYLSSVNDLKYIGDQFKVGKLDPNLKSSHERRFQKMYNSRLKKLKINESAKIDPASTLSDYKRTKDPKFLLDPRFTLTNELKFTGQQFKVGKLDPKIISPAEKRFQERFKSQLKNLLPNPNTPRKLDYTELKDIQNKLIIKKK